MIRSFAPRAQYVFFCMLLLSTLVGAQFHADNAHRGLYASASIRNEAEPLWQTKTGGAVRSTPAIEGDRLYVGSSDGSMYCMGLANGAIRWKFPADGAVTSSPSVHRGIVYFASRANTLYAVRARSGALLWKKSLGTPLPYEWGFDYYVGSPTIEHETLYIGSAAGKLYALDAGSGRELWTFTASSMIRSTPAVDASHVYFGDCSGKVFALDRKKGTLVWTFATAGDTLNNAAFGFDRKAVIASPALYQNMLFIGGRDGFLYALDRSTGREVWRYDYQVSWVISTAAIKDSLLVTGTSDGRFVHALHVKDGTQLWRFATQGPVWASPAISGNGAVVIPGNDGYVYGLDLRSGAELWRRRIGPPIFSSPVLRDSMVYFGSDDGEVIALGTRRSSRKPAVAIHRAVFWMKNPVVQPFRSGMDVAIRDYFIREGYEYYDETDIREFLLARMRSDTASVIIFATNYFPASITQDTMRSTILRLYLERGGKVVILGMNPAAYQIDSVNRRVTGLDFSQSERITGISYRYKDLRSHGGFYHSAPTVEGRAWGLTRPFVAIAGMPVGDVSLPLAIDENGNATAWVKHFSAHKGAGFVQLYLTPERVNELPEVQRVAEYGLR